MYIIKCQTKPKNVKKMEVKLYIYSTTTQTDLTEDFHARKYAA
jgi:hypothetical protein